MKRIKTKDAVGHVLCHDITQIIKDSGASVLFKKGHVVRQEDIERMLSVGKDHLFIYAANDDQLHENQAAKVLYQACAGDGMTPTPVREGKIEVITEVDGLLKVDTKRLQQINELGDLIIATRHNNTVVQQGDKLAGTRIIPLVIAKEKMDRVARIAGDKPLLEVKAFHSFKVGVITTGNEVYHQRIQDTFTPVIRQKLEEYGLTIAYHEVVPDEVGAIQAALDKCREQGIQLIICSGGMSIDPDDVTPTAIKASGVDIVSYGAPVLPGSMLLVGYLDQDIPILGLPGCAMYAKTTSFDLLLPRILAKDTITKSEMAELGHGGLCLRCQQCTYPHCAFGKG